MISYFWIKPCLIFSFYLCLRLASPNYAFMRRHLYSKRKVKEYNKIDILITRKPIYGGFRPSKTQTSIFSSATKTSLKNEMQYANFLGNKQTLKAIKSHLKGHDKQNLQNLTHDHFILNSNHSYWQDLALNWYTSFFAHLLQSHGPRFMPKFCFRSISWKQMDRISPNFIYAFILTRSTLELLHIIFGTFVPELWPLIDLKISFRLNILRTNGQILTKLYIYLYWRDLHWDC